MSTPAGRLDFFVAKHDSGGVFQRVSQRATLAAG